MRADARKIDRFLRRAAVISAAALALSACASRTPSAVAPGGGGGAASSAAASPTVAAGQPAQVALLAPLSSGDSRSQSFAADLEVAARMAAETTRSPGVDLRVYDTGGGAASAAEAARRATTEGAQIIIGPLYSASTRAVRPVAEQTGVPVLSFSSDSAAGGAPVWVMGDLPENEVDRIMAYAASQGVGSVALVRPDNDYGRLVGVAAPRSASRYNLPIVSDNAYARSFEGVQSAVPGVASDILASGASGALIADGGQALRTVGSFLAYYDVTQPRVRYLGLGLWNAPDTLAEAPLRGGWFAAVDPAADDAFEAQFRERTGRAPHPLASLAYDAVRAVESMTAKARASGSNRPFEAAAITDPQGFDGVRGPFRLTPEGGNRRALAVLEVGNGGFAVRDPAPAIASAGL